jgi:dolichol-phosphate mannosyltransferase
MLSAQISRFTLIGAFGAVMNLILLSVLVDLRMDYIAAGIIANEATIISNFIMQERMVFNGVEHRRPISVRFLQSFGFNTLEGMARMPFLYLLVEFTPLSITVAQGVALCIAFFLRYLYHLKLVYAPRKAATVVAAPDEAAVSPEIP